MRKQNSYEKVFRCFVWRNMQTVIGLELKYMKDPSQVF